MGVIAGDGYLQQPPSPRPPYARFNSLVVDRNWRQFSPLSIDLTERLTIVAGGNNAGKTTILNILASHFSWNAAVVGSPIRTTEGEFGYSVESSVDVENVERDRVSSDFGSISYDDGHKARIATRQVTNGAAHGFLISPQPPAVPGIYLTATRSTGQYQAVLSIPPAFSRPSNLFSEYVLASRSRETGTSGGSREGVMPMLLMKEALLAAAIYGEGNSSVTGDGEARSVWLGFQDVLRSLLPSELKFARLKAEPPDIVVETQNGRFGIDAASGSLSALLDAAWQIFVASRLYEKFTVCFDEPENHLHPTMQRTVMPGLLSAFPSVNFVVATHSPFVVTSVRDACVYALTADEGDRVVADRLDLEGKAVSAEAALHDVLGVPSTLPIWADVLIRSLVNEYVHSSASPAELATFVERLTQSGLEAAIPAAVMRMIDAQVDAGLEGNE